jgi:hypothetical protein
MEAPSISSRCPSEKGEVLAAFAAHKGEVNEGYEEAVQPGR